MLRPFATCWLLFSSAAAVASLFTDQPRIETDNGHLVIYGATEKNVSLVTSGQGTINVNGQNLGVMVDQARRAVSQFNRMRDLLNSPSFSDTRSQIQTILRRLDSLESNRTYAPAASNPSTQSYYYYARRMRALEIKVRNIQRDLGRNECQSDPCLNGASCLDLYKGYYCQCMEGWEGVRCEKDVNECARFAGTDLGCQNNAVCINKPGRYECQCSAGFYGIHCTKRTNDCSGSNSDMCDHGVCVTQATGTKGFTCICDQGWKSDGVSAACSVDVDECETAPCSVNPPVQCHNRPGTFFCGPCPPGYTGNGFACYDVDECQINNGGCSTTPMVSCINTLGSSRCGLCPPGYSGDGRTCVFVGKCNVDNGGCHSLAACQEFGSNVRCTCLPGYSGLGVGPFGCLATGLPVTQNPCASSPCLNGGVCRSSSSASFTCSCLLGYSGPTCAVPVSSCLVNPCKNGGTCIQRREQVTCRCPPQFVGKFCQTEKLSCNGFIRSDEGMVEYPPANGSSIRQVNCAWIIMVSSSKVVSITFDVFDLKGPDCNCPDCEFVQLFDGRTLAEQVLGRFCGSSLPNNGTVLSSTNYVYIWWRSYGGTSTRRGFKLRWNATDPVCGGDVDATQHGTIKSPGYPGKYPPNRDCHWKITAPLDKKIVFTFVNLNIKSDSNCTQDFLEFRESWTTDQHHEPTRYCNSETPAPVTSTGNTQYIHFHSDVYDSDLGFQITYHAVPGIPGCGGLFTEPSGEITPPTQNGNYLKNLNCVWIIKLPKDLKIQGKFMSIDLETSQNCQNDFVEIRDGGDDDSPLIGKYCGRVEPPSFTSESNILFFRFRSDYSLQVTGFRFTYYPVCGVTFRGDSGVITSPGYPFRYRNKEDCIYLIEQPPGRNIVLTFQDFDVEFLNSRMCYFDYVAVRDGHDRRSPLIGKFCGALGNIPTPIISSHNYLWLLFHTDNDVAHRGFYANYTTIDTSCGGIYTAPTGYIESQKGVSGEYPPNHFCRWVLSAKPGFVIQLTFSRFRLEEHADCIFDYVLVYDNVTSSTAGGLMGRFCGHKIPPILTSSQNLLTVIFRSDFSSSWEGFAANYVSIDGSSVCGGRYISEQGTIKSPNWPQTYPDSRSCVWVIKTTYGKKISLQVLSFEMEDSTDCVFDHLEIRDGGQDSSPMVGTYCGTKGPVGFISQSNSIYMKFVSDFSRTGRGFRIRWDGTLTGCGGDLSAVSGSIISPNYPEPYGSDSNCLYRITVSQGSNVELSVMDLETECFFDYVEVFDGADENAQMMSKMCSSTNHPAIFVSNSNKMFLRFISDMSNQGKGFFFKYRAVCSKNLVGFRGVIESPNFPNSIPPPSSCTWVITAPMGNKINLTFSDYELIDPDCKSNHIKIEEGPLKGPASNVLGSYCSTKPPLISSNLEVVYVTLDPDNDKQSGHFRIEWIVNGCGGTFTKNWGSFSSPNYPNTYPEKTQCEWVIRVDPGKSIRLTIRDISLEKTKNCAHDSITVYGGADTSAPELTKLCNSQAEVVQIESSSYQMLVKFHSDFSVSGKGFTANYMVINAICGGVLTAPQGSIHTRNYPKNYGVTDDCTWFIQVDSNHLVNLTFIDFDIASDDNCTDSFVQVYDGPSVQHPVLGTYCGNSLPPNTSVRSKTNYLTVRFRAAGQGHSSAKGFVANYTVACGARITALEPGVIKLNDHLNYKEQNNNCSWTILAPEPDGHVTLTLTHMDISPRDVMNDTCDMNRIVVYDGEGERATSLGLYCGVTVPLPLVSKGNVLVLNLISLRGGHQGFFQATYSSVSSACGGDFSNERGSIATPSYPASYPPNAECVWTIMSSPGNKVELSFKLMDITETERCAEDYVEVREQTGGGKLLGVYCGTDIPNNLTAVSTLWIKFRSGNLTAGGGRGFLAEYNLVYGNELEGATGQIANPAYPRPFIHYMESSVTWRITGDFGTRIKISFKEFHIDSGYRPGECDSALTVFDGYDSSAPKLQTLCGVMLPEPIIASSNVVFISLTNYPYRFGSLFLLEWTQQDRVAWPAGPPPTQRPGCGGNIFLYPGNVSGVDITSPGYPNGYSMYIQCVWIVETVQEEHVILSVNMLNIVESEFCSMEYIQVSKQEEGSDTWTKIQNLCLSNQTSVILEGTNKLKVVFMSSWSNTNRTGFNITVSRGCGGAITKSSGVIEFNWGAMSKFAASRWIRMGASCKWTVTVAKGRRIQANFTQLDLPAFKNGVCTEKFVRVLNGGTDSSPLLGKGTVCDAAPPLPATTSNMLYVMLRTSYMSGSFKLEYRELSHDCGGRIRIDAGAPHTLTSPNYPNAPPPMVECIWTFLAPPGKSLQIDFLDRFDLSHSGDCTIEYVEMRDGGTEYAEDMGRYCREKPSTKRSTGNMLYFKYFSNTTEPKNGFKAMVSLARCGGILVSYQGVVTSPGYPNSYPYNTACSWVIENDVRYRLSLQFMDLDLPRRPAQTVTTWRRLRYNNNRRVGVGNARFEPVLSLVNCSDKDSIAFSEPSPEQPVSPSVSTWDRLANAFRQYNVDVTQLRRPYVRNTALAVVCNSTSPLPVITTSSNKVTIVFSGGSEVVGGNYRGFKLSYSTLEGGCDEMRSTPSGVITSPNYPSERPSYYYCNWRIEVPVGRRVQLEVQDFDLAGSSMEQRITLYNDNQYRSRLVTLYSNATINSIYKSSSNQMLINFWSNSFSGAGHRGFKFRYTSDEPALCGGILNNTNGMIEAPANQSSFWCEWELLSQQWSTNQSTALFITNANIGTRTYCNPQYSPVLFIAARTADFQVALCNKVPDMIIRSPYVNLKIAAMQGSWFGNVSFNLQYRVSPCGGIVRGPEAVIVSPGYDTDPRQYPADVDCAWLVTFPEGSTVRLKVEELNLEPSCSDFLTIKNGAHYTSPVLHQFCGTSVPAMPQSLTISEGSTLFVEFHSDGQNQGMGFRLVLDTASAVCGGIIHSEDTELMSPNYPSAYGNLQECEWEIRSAPGTHIGLVFLDRFFLEENPTCANDFVEVSDYVDNTWRVLSKLCGRSLPPTINSTSTRMKVLFRSNSAVNGDGFKARWYQNCGGTLTSSRGTIVSPGYPNNYPSNSHCVYYIDVGKVPINLNFTFFQIEADYRGSCGYDSVTVSDSHQSWGTDLVMVGKFCGTQAPNPLSLHSKVMIEFISDEYTSNRGFVIDYYLQGCGGFINESKEIRFDNENSNKKTATCVWDIQAPEGKIVILRFSRFNLMSSFACDYGGLSGYNGLSTNYNASLLGKICGDHSQNLPVLRSSTNYMSLKTYYYFSPTDNYGFTAFVYFTPVCGDEITLGSNPETVMAPDLDRDGFYDPFLSCMWEVTAPADHYIIANIVSLDVDNCNSTFSNGTCNCDYVELRDGEDQRDLLVRACGVKTPNTVTTVRSSGNIISLNFVTDGTFNRVGFKVTFSSQLSPCGQSLLTVKEAVQTMSTPMYPGSYPPNTRCKWIISHNDTNYSYSSQAIHIHIEEWDIEDSPDCENDYITIEDSGHSGVVYLGDNMKMQRTYSESPQIIRGKATSVYFHGRNTQGKATLCGAGKGFDFYANSMEVVVTFVSNSENAAKGVKMEYSVGGCTRNYTNEQGQIQLTYLKENTHCYILVKAPLENQTVSLYYGIFSIYSKSHADCDDAYVEVRDGDGVQGNLIGKYCGFTRPSPSFATGRSLWLHIYSANNKYSSMDMTYTSTDQGQGCGGRMFGMSGVFTSQGYPYNVRNNTLCTWDISVPQGQDLVLTFTMFDVGPANTCGTDFVEVFDVKSGVEDALRGKYCGGDVPANIRTSADGLKVNYKTSVHNGGAGWSAKFLAVDPIQTIV